MNARALIPLAAICASLACGSDKLRRAAEGVEVVGGTPAVDTGLPGVDRGDGGTGGNVYGPAAPYQVDSFTQQQVQKVDILWVIDDSPSMALKQQKLKDNVSSFIQFLRGQQIDYHLGVTTTDTFNPLESGRLQSRDGAPLFISPDAGTLVEADFVKNATVGEKGSGDEKGLLGGMFALTPPLSPLSPQAAANCIGSGPSADCFLRPDAALYTILVSDEEDSSCSPGRAYPDPAATEGCDEDAIRTRNGYGSIDYWTRFYAGVKGAGGTSRVAAITAVDNHAYDCKTEFAGFCDANVNAACSMSHPDCAANPFSSSGCCQAIAACYRSIVHTSQWCFVQAEPGTSTSPPHYQVSGSWTGCKSTDPQTGQIQSVAFYAPRYAAIATATGGIATSICDDSYLPALSKLGLQASGLRSDFPLSRTPISTSITVLVDGVKVAANGWSYVGCESRTAVNAIRFTPAARPAAGQKIAASYDVNVRGLTCP